jgi:hypothetical protein
MDDIDYVDAFVNGPGAGEPAELSSGQAALQIALLLDGEDWETVGLDEIAAILRRAGFVVDGPE